ncbi:uncharacterized protein PAN0_009d3708 [Moesziomyces antarcticus]|uniref:Uncharacterized protein n=1 Tax=Pseudozyma antarctica TaxID=84753 RepID=A0A081CFP5_PSEA2|nr:uncharacterized protein PAN0_009d3708 [Moesziomyces antarcticus]GAK65491.1 hypothetical protein PAN0_009d3708 [Moesziomyces antarcticus]
MRAVAKKEESGERSRSARRGLLDGAGLGRADLSDLSRDAKAERPTEQREATRSQAQATAQLPCLISAGPWTWPHTSANCVTLIFFAEHAHGSTESHTRNSPFLLAGGRAGRGQAARCSSSGGNAPVFVGTAKSVPLGVSLLRYGSMDLGVECSPANSIGRTSDGANQSSLSASLRGADGCHRCAVGQKVASVLTASPPRCARVRLPSVRFLAELFVHEADRTTERLTIVDHVWDHAVSVGVSTSQFRLSPAVGFCDRGSAEHLPIVSGAVSVPCRARALSPAWHCISPTISTLGTVHAGSAGLREAAGGSAFFRRGAALGRRSDPGISPAPRAGPKRRRSSQLQQLHVRRHLAVANCQARVGSTSAHPVHCRQTALLGYL